MRKTFKFFCAAVVAAFAVSSCYDDALVWDELDKHAGEIAGLEERVAALETKLNSEVAAINKVVSTLQGNVTALQGDVKDLTAADAELLSKLNGLSSEDKKLTDALAGLQAVVDAMAEPVDSLADVTTAIQESIKEALEELDALDGTVDGAVTDFEKALATLEKTLKDADAANLAAVQAAIAALDVEGLAEELDGVSADLAAAILTVAVVDVEKLDNGDIVLTLKDNTTLTIPAKDENANNESLVTTVTENGVAYWAVVGEDGEATAIVDGEGNKIPVGHPIALEFRMGDSGTLEYSTDGGQTFTDTGLSASVPDLTVAVVKNFVDNGSYVSMTIGGVAVNLPKYVAEDLSAELSRENMFVSYGSSKTVELTVADATEYYVMAKPDGWKAKFDENVLTVTAPSKKAAEADAAELEGEILVHANTASGKCTVVKLDVKTGVALSLNIDAEGNLEVFNAKTVRKEDDMYGDVWYEFESYSLYLIKKSDFDSDSETFWEDLHYGDMFYNEFLGNTNTIKINNEIRGAYVEGVYEEDTWEVALSKLLDVEDLDPGTAYTIIGAYGDRNGFDLSKDWAYCEFETPVGVSLTATEVSASDIVFSLDIAGPAGYTYYINAIPPQFMGVASFDEFMTIEGEGLWWQFKNYSSQNMGEMFLGYYMFGYPYDVNTTSVNLSDIVYNGVPVQANTEYYVYVYPYDPDKAVEDYSYETDLKPYVYTFTTGGYTVNETLEAPTFEHKISYYSIISDVILPEEADMIYYYIYSESEYGELVNNDELLDDLLFQGYAADDDATYNPVNDEYIQPGTNWYIVACALYGNELSPIAAEKVEVPALPLATEFTCDVTAVNYTTPASTTVTFATEASYVAYRTNSTNTWDNFAKNMVENAIKTGEQITVNGLTVAPVTDGTVTVTVDASSQLHVLYSAFNWDDENNKVETFTSPAYVKVSTWTAESGQ